MSVYDDLVNFHAEAARQYAARVWHLAWRHASSRNEVLRMLAARADEIITVRKAERAACR